MGCFPHVPIRPFGFAWGKHPIDFSGHGSIILASFMFKHKILKAVFGNANRSGFHCFVTPVPIADRTAEAGFDVLGGVMVVSLSAGVVLLMRLVLAN